MKRSKRGFTLAEVLITLAIIGVVAAVAIPSVIANSQQQEFKTGLKKAVSVLNSAITMNMAIDGETPYENADLFNYLQRHMNVVKPTTARLPWSSMYKRADGTVTGVGANYAFYTLDGMRFEFQDDGDTPLKLHEGNGATACIAAVNGALQNPDLNKPGSAIIDCRGHCGSYGLSNNPNGTTRPPCAILVDVNGDRKPSPSNINTKYIAGDNTQVTYKAVSPGSKIIGDIFTVLITEDRAIPYGVIAQKAMYEAQKQGY